MNGDVREFRTWHNALYSMTMMNYYNSDEFLKFTSDPFFYIVNFVVVFIIGLRVLYFCIVSATCNYLFGKAFSLEKGGNIKTPTQRMRMIEMTSIKEKTE